MAKAQEAAPAQDEAAPKKKGGKMKKMLLILMILVLVLALAAGGVIAFLLSKKGSGEEGAEAATTAVVTVDLSKPPTFVALDPFVVNLAPGEGDRFLQVVMSLRVSDAKTGEHLKGFMPQIRHRINLLLASKLPSELAPTQGREHLAGEIVHGVNEVLGFPVDRSAAPDAAPAGPVQAVLFSSFIIQ
ncbi:MAG: flagellar basal body-associated FliL family protein [Rhodocyclaceae bacterium]|nr:flagellar basal body-associated FliL family protein [Rhodocyclaceae bacterium]